MESARTTHLGGQDEGGGGWDVVGAGVEEESCACGFFRPPVPLAKHPTIDMHSNLRRAPLPLHRPS